MLNMRSAAVLLASAQTTSALVEVLRAAGVCTDVAELDSQAVVTLGFPPGLPVSLARGPGLLRIAVLPAGNESSLRPALQRLARRLSSRAPHILWLAAVIDASRQTAAIAGWIANGTGTPHLPPFMWEPDRLVDSDAETLCALSATRGETDSALHTRYLEILGRDALTRRFYRALEREVTSLARSVPSWSKEDGHAVALLYASRLLFLRFLEAKGWLDGDRDFVATRFDECMRSGGGFDRRVLLPLFFGTLNTPVRRRAAVAREFGRVPFLNGGLFTRTLLERRVGRFHFPDECFGALLERVFLPYRFVAREDTATWSEASVDPEMLGRAFESFMASSERRDSGVFYTPHALVSRVAESALEGALDASAGIATRNARLASLRVLDPACGSGAFLVYMLEKLSALRGELGDARDWSEIRRDVLSRSIFGVDRNPTAVWLCELRLWLSVVVESGESDPMKVAPLPNLDRNIRVGDALTGAAFTTDFAIIAGSARVTRLRERYVRATGKRKDRLAQSLDQEERTRHLACLDREISVKQFARRERLAAQRARDLFGQRAQPGSRDKRELRRIRDELRRLHRERRRLQDGGALPFSFAVSFADAQAAGGFDIVIGNPPWVRLHRIPAALRVLFKQSYEVFRSAPWSSGAAFAGVARGFASQVDLAALFVERSVALLRYGGVLSLLLPAKLWRSLSGGGVRALVAARAPLVRLEDLSGSRHAFDAAVYPSLLVAQSGDPARSEVSLAIHGPTETREWNVARDCVSYDTSLGAPWLLLSLPARKAFDRLRRAGVALATSPFGAPRLGVKSGCNAAFLVRVADVRGKLACVIDANGERGTVEASLLRPVLRGETVRAWKRDSSEEWIVWTHGPDGAPLRDLPEYAARHLRRYYGQLSSRSDAARARRWWCLFRTDAADNVRARVVWSDFGLRPRALSLDAGDPAVPLNTCYVVSAEDSDATALTAILNSGLAAAWLNVLAEPARGAYRRYMGWTVGQLPLPRRWPEVRDSLSRAGFAARDACSADADEALNHAVLDAYGLRSTDVVALLDWKG